MSGDEFGITSSETGIRYEEVGDKIIGYRPDGTEFVALEIVDAKVRELVLEDGTRIFQGLDDDGNVRWQNVVKPDDENPLPEPGELN